MWGSAGLESHSLQFTVSNEGATTETNLDLYDYNRSTYTTHCIGTVRILFYVLPRKRSVDRHRFDAFVLFVVVVSLVPVDHVPTCESLTKKNRKSPKIAPSPLNTFNPSTSYSH